jgi:predicted RNA-binding Zn-ribbon protein involved in translation (DUF1610 family)
MASSAKMKTLQNRSKGTWWHRFTIRILTLILTVLVFWLLGFFVDDIRSFPGPDYTLIEEGYLDQELVALTETLGDQIEDLNRDIGNESEKQRVLGDGSRNLQQTITQLLELQKLGLENNVTMSDSEQQNFNSTLNLFLENQRQYQESSQSSATLLSQKQGLESQLAITRSSIDVQRLPAREAFEKQRDAHRLKLAFWQLGVLLPILIASAILLMKQRGSIYFPLYFSLGIATLIKVGLVIHEYFPTRYFKYILIASLLLVVGRILIHFIRLIAFPKVEWLVKQYREAYERFLCPICEYPIRTGPRRYLFWTRRSVAKLTVPAAGAEKEEAYTCPSCGNGLYSECHSCHHIRHALLPHCQHCGEKGEIECC